MKRLAVCVAIALLALSCEPDHDGIAAVRLGYFPNITHSQALIGVARGDFQRVLGNRATLDPKIFNAGPSVIEALFAGQIDVAYIGPNPAINAWVRSRGEALHVIAGATSGGASLVVRPQANIRRPQDLAGRKLASPQLGNTQDVALRRYLAANGLAPREKGGNVDIVPTDNPQILDLFRRGAIDGAWVPEPWGSRLVVEGGGTVFVDEQTLWPNGEFVTAELIASTRFLRAHPQLVRALLQAHVTITQWELAHPQDAQGIVNREIERISRRKLDPRVLAAAWGRMHPTWDPMAPSLVSNADAAYAAGFLRSRPDLTGICDLAPLDAVLAARGLRRIGR